MLIGGIWVDEATLQAVNKECAEYKKSIGWKEDTKFNWKKISKQALEKYYGFIDIFLSIILGLIVLLSIQKR